jgi:hypothetical protein
VIRESEAHHEEVFRPRLAPLLAFGWYLVAVFVAVDLVRRGDSRSIPIGLACLGLVTVVVYAVAQRPAVVANDSGVLLRNVLRDVWVPWRRVQRVGAAWSLTIETSEATYGSWAVTATNRARERERGRRVFGVGPVVHDDTVPADETSGLVSATLARMQERAARRDPDGATGGQVEVRLAKPVVAGFAVCLAVLVVALVV